MAKILLVEDDNNLREIYEARLQAEGYETATASDGEQALVVAKETRPDLVISDVMMPKISGFEMLDILRNTDGMNDVKVIMLTALGQSEDKSRADQLGADKYLVKSQVTLEDIVKTAHQLLDGDVDVAPAAPTVTQAAAAPATPATPIATEIAPPVSVAAADIVETPPPAAVESIVTSAAEPTPQVVADQTAIAESDQSAAMAAQIDAFVADPATAIDPVAVEPTAEPAIPEEGTTTSVTAVTNDTPQAHDDQVMADAVRSLSGDTTGLQSPSDVTAVEVEPPSPVEQTPAAPPTPATPTAASTNDDESVTVAHKKIIQPLNDPATKPDIHKLLEAEQAAEAANQPVPPPPAGSTVQEQAEIQEPAPDPNKPNPNDIAL